MPVELPNNINLNVSAKVLNAKILEADVPNKNGVIWSEAVLISIFNKVDDDLKRLKPVFGYAEKFTDGMPLDRVSHVVSAIRLVGKKLFADIDIWKTTQGEWIRDEIFNLDLRQHFRPRGTGRVLNGYVVDFNFLSIDFVRNPA